MAWNSVIFENIRMTEGFRTDPGTYRQYKKSSGKDTRKENEKITKPERKMLYNSRRMD